jgi:hypothetical protein
MIFYLNSWFWRSLYFHLQVRSWNRSWRRNQYVQKVAVLQSKIRDSHYVREYLYFQTKINLYKAKRNLAFYGEYFDGLPSLMINFSRPPPPFLQVIAATIPAPYQSGRILSKSLFTCHTRSKVTEAVTCSTPIQSYTIRISAEAQDILKRFSLVFLGHYDNRDCNLK